MGFVIETHFRVSVITDKMFVLHQYILKFIRKYCAF